MDKGKGRTFCVRGSEFFVRKRGKEEERGKVQGERKKGKARRNGNGERDKVKGSRFKIQG